MTKQAEVEVWDLHEPIMVCPENDDSGAFSVAISPFHSRLPDEYEQMVDDVWQDFCDARPDAKDNQAFYLTEYRRSEGNIEAIVESRKFRYNQAFNRGEGLPGGRRVSAEHNILPLTIMSYVLTKNRSGGRDVIFGRKASYGKGRFDDRFSMSSIAGGFANHEDLAKDCRHVDLMTTVRRLLAAELGEQYLPSIERVENIGLIYSDILPNRGFDMAFLVYLDADTEAVVEPYEGMQQYAAKGLVPCAFEPDSLADIVGDGSIKFSKQATAMAYSAVAINYGKEEAERFLKRIEPARGNILVLQPFLDGKVRGVLSRRDYSSD